MSDELCPFCSDETCVNNGCKGYEACNHESMPLDMASSRDGCSSELPLSNVRMKSKEKMGMRENSDLGISRFNMIMSSSNGDVDVSMEPVIKMNLCSAYYN